MYLFNEDIPSPKGSGKEEKAYMIIKSGQIGNLNYHGKWGEWELSWLYL